MDKIIKLANKFEKIFLLKVIRRGMTMMIPIVLIASFALALTSFPVPAVVNMLQSFCGGIFYHLLSYIRDFSFSYFSVLLTLSISISYVMEKKVDIGTSVFAPLASCVSFLLISHLDQGGTDVKMGTQGSFLAIVVALSISALYVRLVHSRLSEMGRNISGHDVMYSSAMRALMPMLAVMSVSAIAAYFIYNVCQIDNIIVWFAATMENAVEKLNSQFAISVICGTLIHLMWFLGIHGSNVLDGVMKAHSAVGEGIIFSKTFFDVFVLMGGCGTSVCIILSILIFSKRGKLKNLARSALVPVALNINELITFGLPIIWNPVMFIPFLAVPMECTLITYAAMKLGMVHPVVSEVTWTTPILVSGYLATGGSASGILIQLLNIAIGTVTYAPFIRFNEYVYSVRVKNNIAEITDEVRRAEKEGTDITFLDRIDTVGIVGNLLMDDLRRAIQNKELYFLYQPQFMADGTCVGAEALIRWRHPLGGLIYPPLIIYLAQQGGFLSELEKLIFDMGCRAIKEVEEKSRRRFKISVNITAKSLMWDGLENCIAASVGKYGIKPERLWIEITEQDILSRDKEIIDKITNIKNKGHSFLIDDFGMGRTSIMYLQTKLFDGVKLDGSLIQTVTTDNTNKEIVSSVIQLSEKLGIRVIAEYVETEEHCIVLDAMGCDWYQGYYFSRPVPLEEFIERLNGKGQIQPD